MTKLDHLSPSATRTLEGLERAFKGREWNAIEPWLGNFYPFQLEALLDWGRFCLALKSRQIGWSFTNGAKGTLWGLFGETTTIVSIGEREANEVLAAAFKHAAVLEALGSELARRGPKTSELILASGGRFLAVPSTSGGRSFSGNAILDEYGYLQDPEGVWDAASGSATLGYRIHVNSTPNGVGNDWYNFWHDASRNAAYRKHCITIDDAIAQGYPVDLAECWSLCRGDPREFDQKYRCKFLDNASQYIPSEFLATATALHDAEAHPGDKDGATYGGVDIGLERDLLVLVIVRKVGSIRWVVHCESHQGAVDDLVLDDLFAKAFDRKGWNCRRVCADATGLGEVPAKRAARQYGQRFEGVKFTQPVKETLTTGFYASASRQELRLPRSYLYNGRDEAPLLRDDICAIRRTVTAANNVRYDAPRTKAGHADRAWAVMLALHACEGGGEWMDAMRALSAQTQAA